jgi:hypothetical protein
MSYTTTLYEGDGLIHFAPRPRAAVKPRVKTRSSGHVARSATPHSPAKGRTHHLATVKAARILIGAVWNALKSVALWIDEKSREAHYQRVESYLAQSTDHADLERRLRDLERSNRLNWIDCGSR